MKKKEKPISILQRHEPVFRRGKNVLYQNGKRRDQFDGHSVPEFAYFGQLANGRRFIVMVDGTKIGMVSYRSPEKWKNTFYPEILDLLKKAGVNFKQNAQQPVVNEVTIPKKSYSDCVAKRETLHRAQGNFSPFAKLTLDISSTKSVPVEHLSALFRFFDISLETEKEIRSVSDQLFKLECNYMKSELEDEQKKGERLAAINRWYFFLYTDGKDCPLNAAQEDLYRVDVAYLKSVYSRNGSESELKNRFFLELLLASAQVLKQVPVNTGSGFYQLARRTHNKKTKIFSATKEKDCTEKKFQKVPDKFEAAKQTLYVYKGIIRCLKNQHPIVCVNAHVPTVSNLDAVLNVNFCKKCKRFYIGYDEYTYYLHKYKSLLTRIVLVNESGTELHPKNFAEASPLRLCGYSVAQNTGYSKQERELLLTEVIHNGIMKKQDVIQYLNWFIKMNGQRKENEQARAKWESDLEFVRCLDMEHQNDYIIANVEAYRSENTDRIKKKK